MPQWEDFNTKYPNSTDQPRTRSSSSVSLNESPITDDINYDSDISEDDDHAIAEGEDDEDDDEDEGNGGEEEDIDEGFEVEVSTLTGNTFSVMIQPQDTVEVLKTRIAFQEGISPADQNLVLEQGQGKLLDPSMGQNTLEELNISRNSRLTLVTNVSSGVPFKNGNCDSTSSLNGASENMNLLNYEKSHLWDSSPSARGNRVAPTLRRSNAIKRPMNYGNSLNLPQSQSNQNLRLPKILSSNGNDYCNGNSNSKGNGNDRSNPLQMENGNGSPLPEQLQREWMQSLFNKDNAEADAEEEVDLQLEENGGISLGLGVDDDYDIDSTTGRLDSTILSHNETRYGRKSRLPKGVGEEDSNILVVKGDDGVILIIQKNSGILEDSHSQSGQEDNISIELGVHPGRVTIPDIEKMKQKQKSRQKQSYNHSHNQSVQERIKENAVTLEKMRQVRTLMAQKKTEHEQTQEKRVEFPKISNGLGVAGIQPKQHLTVPGGGGVKSGYTRRTSANNTGRNKPLNPNRSINSSKMSLNRLIAEIYLQSKRKGYSFQPGQPPYTEQQLVRYVQLKVAILLDEQRKNKTEPCSKCILDNDWNFSLKESRPYLIPTVVMNRYKRLTNSRSLDKELELNDNDNDNKSQHQTQAQPSNLQRRKSTISDALNFPTTSGTRSQIPRLVPANQRTNVTITGTASNASTSTLSRRSSSSVPPGIGGSGGTIPPIMNGERGRTIQRSVTNANQYIFVNNGSAGMEEFDFDDLNCDNYDDDGRSSQSIYIGTGSDRKRPSLKIHQKIYTTTSGSVGVGYTSKKSSRPGSSGKSAGKAKKPASVRCPVCKKRIGIANRYQCRCGLTFCSIHRYPECHECTFDYKTEGRNKIREANPVIVAQKITEI